MSRSILRDVVRLVTILGGLTFASASAADRPNIVFILTDDQAPTAVGIAGNSEIKTPHLDRLFRDGATLVNSFVTTPVCSPSRASLMTSRYSSELGIFDWINPRRETEHGLDPATVTWPELFAQAGYANGLVGKWHLGTADRFHPTKTGFHHFAGFRSGGTRVKNPPLEIDGKVKPHKGLTTDILTDYAIEFLKKNQHGPFLLCLHYRAPHAPWLPVRDEDWTPYEKLDPTIPNPDFPKLNVDLIKKRTREYYASVSGVDRNVGRLMRQLDALKLTDNTVVIFTSDHGYNLGHNGVWYKGNAQWQLTELPPQKWPNIPRKQRPNLYDQALRVPTAIRWPGVIKPGTQFRQTITNLDWYPTLLAIAGIERPKEVLIRGRNFMPILRGARIRWDNDLFAEYSMKHGAQTHMRAIRTPKWKLMIDFLNKGRAELYNLEKDPAETTNLIDSQDDETKKIKDKLRQRIWATMQLIDDPALKISYSSHPPMRRLPRPSSRPLGRGPARFVDAERGDDANVGSQSDPWKSIVHGLTQLEPGWTLYLRSGTYYETVTVENSGTAERPITIRAFPGELAIVDSGYPDFHESPATAWELVDEKLQEFRSTKSYPRGGGFGNFGDSMVPFQRYLTFHDLRSKNELWHKGLSNRADDPVGIYAGPGVRRDPETGRIHIRLSHTRLAGLGDNHYRGETDPRKIPLVIARADYAVSIVNAKHVRLQDLVVRGAQRSAVRVEDSQNVELDGLTLYGSGSALQTAEVDGLRLTNSVLRGHAAPWHSRGHHKDRAGAGYLAVVGGTNIEFANCEFTDHHDGVLMQSVGRMKFHHNRVDNFNDDGLEPGPKQKSRRIEIYQNLITRCLTTFTAHGSPNPIDAEPASGVYVFRNVIDLRRGTYKVSLAEPDASGSFLNRRSRVCGDHGSPTWPVFYIYHNTFIIPNNTWRDYYAFGWGGHTRGTTRRIYNNIFMQVRGIPGFVIPSIDDLNADGNLFWGAVDGPTFQGDVFSRFRKSKSFVALSNQSKTPFGSHDIFGDPRFATFTHELPESTDLRLQGTSPAIDAGVDLPSDWPDPLRNADAGGPDIGAFPNNSMPFVVGPNGN